MLPDHEDELARLYGRLRRARRLMKASIVMSIPFATYHIDPTESWQRGLAMALTLIAGVCLGALAFAPNPDKLPPRPASSGSERPPPLDRLELALQRYPTIVEAAGKVAVPVLIALVAAAVTVIVKG